LFLFSSIQDNLFDILTPFSMTTSIKRSLNTEVSTIDINANLPTATVGSILF